MVQDRIEREVFVAASPERVWEIITQAEHVGKWFSDSAEVDLRPGGEMVLRWDVHGTHYATIEKIEAPRYFSYRWSPGSPGEPPGADNSTLVEFTLAEHEGQTRLQVVETGFSRLSLSADERAKHFDSHTDGWAIQARDLQEYVAALVS